MEQFITQNADILVKLGVAVLLGMIIGFERSLHIKLPVGIRTYSMVSLGSALFVVVGTMINSYYPLAGDSEHLRLLGQMASEIIVGVGFLGAGMIIYKDASLFGLTTAAGLWVSAAIGMACGFGFYPIAIMGTLFALIIFTVFWSFEEKIRNRFAPHNPLEKEKKTKK